MVKKRGAITPFLHGGRRNYLEKRRCNKPTLYAKAITHILLFIGSFLRFHVQNKRKRFDDFTVEIECKDTTILRGGKIYFAQRVIIGQ